MRSIVWIMGTSHLFIEVYFLTHVALIPVFLNEFHISILESSLIVAIPTIAGLLTNIFSGFFVDRIGAKPILISGMILQALGGFVVANSVSITPLLLGISFTRIASSFYHNSGYSTMSKVLRKYELSKAMGVHNAMGSVGTSLGLLTLPLVLFYFQWRYTYLVWSIPILIWSLFLLRIKFSTHNSAKKEKSGAKPIQSILTKNFLSFNCAMFFHHAGIAVIITFMTTYIVFARELSEATASLIFAVGPPIAIFSSLTAGYLGSKLNDRTVLIVTMIGSICSVVMMPFTHTIMLLGFVFFCFSFFRGAIWPSIATITASLTPLNRRGVAYSIIMSTQQVAMGGIPLIAANLVESTSIISIFILSPLLISIGLLILLVSMRMRPQQYLAITN